MVRQSLVELSQILNPGVPINELPPIMAVGLYADESETTGKVFTLAGFMATPGAWDRFVPKWRQMLCDVGPYPVDAFHSADIEAAKPPFDGWAKSERDKLVSTALDIIGDTSLCANLFAVSCTFVLEDRLRVLPPPTRSKVADVYEDCYRVLFHNILKRWVFNGIDFIFDEKEKVKGRVKGHFDWAKSVLDNMPEFAGRLNDCSFRDDRKVIPLQAADLLAYEIRRHVATRIAGRDQPMRSAYERIKSSFSVAPVNGPYRERLFRCYDMRFFVELARAIQADPNMSDEKLLDLWYLMDAPED
jgi:hypothetical protein